MKRHEHLDSKILKAINTLSPTSFVSAIEVNDRVKMDKKEFGDHLMVLNKSGQVDITSRDSYPV